MISVLYRLPELWCNRYYKKYASVQTMVRGQGSWITVRWWLPRPSCWTLSARCRCGSWDVRTPSSPGTSRCRWWDWRRPQWPLTRRRPPGRTPCSSGRTCWCRRSPCRGPCSMSWPWSPLPSSRDCVRLRIIRLRYFNMMETFCDFFFPYLYLYSDFLSYFFILFIIYRYNGVI